MKFTGLSILYWSYVILIYSTSPLNVLSSLCVKCRGDHERKNNLIVKTMRLLCLLVPEDLDKPNVSALSSLLNKVSDPLYTQRVSLSGVSVRTLYPLLLLSLTTGRTQEGPPVWTRFTRWT